MPLRDGKPTLHEQRVAELMERDPEFAEAYVHFMAEMEDELPFDTEIEIGIELEEDEHQ